MKIIFWADVHCEHSVKDDNIKGEKASVLILEVLEEHALKEKPDAIVVLGDLFDKHGLIESSLAMTVRERIEHLARQGIKIVLITGNHEYQKVSDEYFGRGILSALFSGKEHENIYVIDEKARFIRLDESHVVLGIPFRDNYEQFQRDSMSQINLGIESGVVNLKKDKVFVGWHVGLPFGTTWRGDEMPNDWISPNHADIKKIFSIANQNRIYLGHYHGPDELFCDGGSFLYVGSPATRTRSESGQQKRVAVWEDEALRFHSTEVLLDWVVGSVKEAEAHQRFLIDRFGEEVLRVATIHIKLDDEASMDDYNVVRAQASRLPGLVHVIKPRINRKGMIDHIVEKHKDDPSSSQENVENDIFRFSIINYFKNNGFKKNEDKTLSAVRSISYHEWRTLEKEFLIDQEKTIEKVTMLLKDRGAEAKDLPAIDIEYIRRCKILSLATEQAEQVINIR